MQQKKQHQELKQKPDQEGENKLDQDIEKKLDQDNKKKVDQEMEKKLDQEGEKMQHILKQNSESDLSANAKAKHGYQRPKWEHIVQRRTELTNVAHSDHMREERDKQKRRELGEVISGFLRSEHTVFHFLPVLNSYERRLGHKLAEEAGLLTCSQGQGRERRLVMTKRARGPGGNLLTADGLGDGEAEAGVTPVTGAVVGASAVTKVRPMTAEAGAKGQEPILPPLSWRLSLAARGESAAAQQKPQEEEKSLGGAESDVKPSVSDVKDSIVMPIKINPSNVVSTVVKPNIVNPNELEPIDLKPISDKFNAVVVLSQSEGLRPAFMVAESPEELHRLRREWEQEALVIPKQVDRKFEEDGEASELSPSHAKEAQAWEGRPSDNGTLDEDRLEPEEERSSEGVTSDEGKSSHVAKPEEVKPVNLTKPAAVVAPCPGQEETWALMPDSRGLYPLLLPLLGQEPTCLLLEQVIDGWTQ